MGGVEGVRDSGWGACGGHEADLIWLLAVCMGAGGASAYSREYA